VNDFDEAWELPWTIVLVRLGVSASLAVRGDKFNLTPPEACQQILNGYKEGLKGGKIEEFALDEGHPRLTRMVKKAFKSDEEFWAAFDDPKSKWQLIKDPPADCVAALHQALPKDAAVETYRVQQGPYSPDKRKPTGLGSLGRPRYCVVARAAGERLVREAKALLPSAAAWAANVHDPAIKIGHLLTKARPFPDPCLRLHAGWIARRISPKSVKVAIEKLQKEGFEPEDEAKLFESMGRETANIHLASDKAEILLKDLRARRDQDADWLVKAVREWRAKVEEDWEAFRG
jgi:hypothetical protein